MARIPLLAALPPIVFAAIAGIFLSGMFRDDPDALPSTLVGQPAPKVAIEPLAGLIPFTDSLLKEPGPKLINFWASWCLPCRVEHPQFMELQAEGLKIYGVNFKDDPIRAQRFLDDLGDPYEGIGGDPDGRMALDWGVYGVPETFVIDGDGNVLLRFAGPVTDVILRKRIRPALAKALAE
jgi:cytochrome c biogenesis protein CcmG/thiol:disulfide interchange protein DsbE